VAGLGAAIALVVRAGRRDRQPEPAVEKEYGISAVTARIDDLYEQLAARRTWRTRRPRRGIPAARVPAADAGASAPPVPVLASAAASEPAPVQVPDSPAAQSVKGQR
jgi:uncharacterized membrane protein